MSEQQQRLYFLGAGVRIQWDGNGAKPDELIRYEEGHAGALPEPQVLSAGRSDWNVKICVRQID